MFLLALFVLLASANESLHDMYQQTINTEPSTLWDQVTSWNFNYRQPTHQKRLATCSVKEDFEHCELPPTTKRSLVKTQGRLAVYISNTTVTTANVVAQLADPQHARALRASRGLYTPEKLAKLDRESFDFYAHTFGPCFNFTGVPFSPAFYGVGAYVTPCGALLPYIIGADDSDPNDIKYDYKVAFDSANVNRGVLGTWRNLAVGNLVLVFASTATPSGNLAAGDVLGFADYTQVDLHAADWSKEQNHETFRIATPFSSKQIPTQFPTPGLAGNLSPLRIFDDCCNAGFGQITTSYADDNLWATGTLRKYLTMTVYWP